MKNSIQELTYLLKSKAKCIWIKTYEEQQCMNDIKQILAKEIPNVKLMTWSFFEGLQQETLSKNEAKPPLQKSISPDALLDKIIKAQNEGRESKREKDGKVVMEYVNKDENIWVLKDFHLCNESKSILRGIRDTKERDPKEMKGYNPIIVISPIVSIPLEHEKLFTILEYETPDLKEINLFLNAFVSKMKQSGKYNLPSDQELADCVNLAQGLTLEEIKNYATRSLIKYNTLSEKIFYQARLDLIKKTGVLEYKECNVGLEEMGGNEVFKDWVEDIKGSFTPEAAEFGVVKPKGYLGVGVPGTSKTLSAEIIANTLSLPLLKFNMSSVMHSHVGQSEKNMDNVLKIVKACSPCVLLVDEVEKTLSGTGSSNQTDGGTLMRIVGQLLEFLGGDDSKDVFTIMTSNNASALPPELTRSGRIDTTWYFGLPMRLEREEIFKIHLGKTKLPLEDDLATYAAEEERTLNFTGAEIKEIVKVAVRKAFKRYKTDGNKMITAEDIDAAIPEVVPVYESSKEKIAVLEEYYRTRARFSNTKPIEEDIETFASDDFSNMDFNLNV